jgi:putative transposase
MGRATRTQARVVRFKLSRPLPAGKLGMARITRDRGGRWHVAFSAPQPAVPGAGRAGRAVGIDRGVTTTLATSDGGMLRAPVMRRRERQRLVRLQRRLARCQRGSRRRAATKPAIARLHQRVADRRRDWVEKTTTQLTARYEVIAVEALPVRNMVRRPKPKPDPDDLGQYLPNGAAAKAGLVDLCEWLGPDRAAPYPKDVRVGHGHSGGGRAVFQSAMPQVWPHIIGKP